MSGNYDDIINLPHHVSAKRPRMSIENRSAQFSPFAALSGYDAAVKETARLTDRRMELGDSDIAVLDTKLNLLSDRAGEQPEVAVTYFVPDGKKMGGEYVAATGSVKKIDDYERAIVFTDGRRIAFADVLELESEAFAGVE